MIEELTEEELECDGIRPIFPMSRPTNTDNLLHNLRYFDSLAMSARSPKDRRFAARCTLIFLLESLGAKRDQRSKIVWEIIDALQLRDSGKMHPLLASSDQERKRSYPWASARRSQATMAATLEYACSDHGLQEKAYAEHLIEVASGFGLRSPAGKRYRHSSLLKWRKQCAEASHPESVRFQLHLKRLREFAPSVEDVAAILADYLQYEYDNLLDLT